jgi:FKBP-type peptidyl-prolyl cis-trans isomerase
LEVEAEVEMEVKEDGEETKLAKLKSSRASSAMILSSPRSSRAQGFAKKVLTEGNNERFPKRGNTVKVHYTGTVRRRHPSLFLRGQQEIIFS